MNDSTDKKDEDSNTPVTKNPLARSGGLPYAIHNGKHHTLP